MMIAYGHEGKIQKQDNTALLLNYTSVESQDDPYIKLIEEGIEYVAHAARPGAFMVEIFPWCKQAFQYVCIVLQYLLL